MRNNNQLCMVIELDEEKFSQGRLRPLHWPTIFLWHECCLQFVLLALGNRDSAALPFFTAWNSSTQFLSELK